MVCISTGSDCTLKMWDIRNRLCIKTTEGERGIQRKFSSYHRETITSLDVNFEEDLAFTGGRDGAIFRNTLISSDYQKMFQNEQKLIITCLKYDEVNHRLWYGTPESQI